jgi:hypothetical protein
MEVGDKYLDHSGYTRQIIEIKKSKLGYYIVLNFVAEPRMHLSTYDVESFERQVLCGFFTRIK